MVSEVSKRYAKALYQVSQAKNKHAQIFSELREVEKAFLSEKSISEFVLSNVVSAENKKEVLSKTLNGKISEELMSALNLMADKNRLSLISEVLTAYQAIIDEANGVTRGVVRSAQALAQAERTKIEDTVKNVVKKNVILSFEEDKNLLGGMVAQVGGWTFDDSLESHLMRMGEYLNRSVN